MSVSHICEWMDVWVRVSIHYVHVDMRVAGA